MQQDLCTCGRGDAIAYPGGQSAEAHTGTTPPSLTVPERVCAIGSLWDVNTCQRSLTIELIVKALTHRRC